MGNACPSGFVASGAGCVYDCGKGDSSFTVFTTTGGQPTCVYRTDMTQSFLLNPVGGMPLTVKGGTYVRTTLDEVKTTNPTLFQQYQAEESRAKQELAVLAEKIGKDKLVRDAFQRLQDAENARDKAPDAYQKARTDYYTLVKGDSWISGERERVARAEVEPEVQKYRNEYVELNNQLNQQAQAYDTMRGIKDKVFSVKDDLTYSADLLMGQVQKLRSQITLDRRKKETDDVGATWVDWLHFALNIILTIVLIGAVWIVFQKLRARNSTPSTFTQGTKPE